MMSARMTALLFLLSLAPLTHAQDRPNILVIWGDDIGYWNVSANSDGMMGYQTPNIDRIANEGVRFTDYYGQQSCTAGRAAFITGQNPFRTGLTKVGLPGADIGLSAEDPTIAEILKPMGYATGQFGKNHFGDKDEFLPSNHGFDEFFGNLYHLNAEEEPEHEDYPQIPGFKEKFGPRGVIHSFADGRVEDTGPLTIKRMETVDDETLAKAMDFIDRAHEAEQPFFVWWNATRMHFRTHIKEETKGLSGQGFYNDGMVEHDNHVGELLDKLDELGIADNTIVFYSTDNGVHFNTWPDAGITPFRGEKNTNWEGAFRVPAVARWPGKFPEGKVINDIMAHQDWFTTLIAAAGDDEIVQKLRRGHRAGGKRYRKYIDGLNFLPFLTGEVDKGPRDKFFYIGDGGEVMAVRVGDWKMVFMEQRANEFDIWREPFVSLRAPKIFHLRRDPFERADVGSNTYNEWWEYNAPYVYLALATVQEAVQSVVDYPPTQKPDSWNLDKLADQLQQTATR
ncbi:MAG: arylsulfatase [Pseudomonadota bacterium]